jgi:hypothetical protein
VRTICGSCASMACPAPRRLFAQCNSKGIAQMADHLMSGHAPPKSLALRTHSTEAIQHGIPVMFIEESL